MKILAVEDDAVAGRILSRALAHLGHEVVAAGDGETAWDLWQQARPRVVVSDWRMPKLDGLDLCRRFREQPGQDYVYFILLTGSEASNDNRRAAADAGVDDFLLKPLDASELWMRLRVAEPMCSYCKKIRDDQNYWQQIEGYINERTGSEFSHSVCPDCYQRVVLPEINQLKASPPVVRRVNAEQASPNLS
jgi:DNA-binding response OmpR family regulator